MGPAAALAYQLSKTEIWNEILKQDLPEEQTVAGIATRGNIITGDMSLAADGRNLLSENQRLELEAAEGGMDDLFLKNDTSMFAGQQYRISIRTK